MNSKKINFKSPSIVLIIILILILILITITLISLNQDKINFSLTNDDSKFNFTFNTENFQDENISQKLNLLAENIKDLGKKIEPLKNSSNQFNRIITKKNYIQEPNYYNL